MPFFPDVRLHVVTGKGGTGKTTVSAALALGLAREGRRTLVVEVEGRQGLARLFGTATRPHEEQPLARAAGGGEVYGLAVDPELALIEYLELFYKMGRAGKLLKRMGAVDFVTTIAPGLRDVLLIGKVKEAVVRRRGADHHYDAVVLDAPPTGRIVRFLGATDEVTQLAHVGPIRTQSEAVMKLLRSSQTAVHLVTLLEEMPVQETVDGVTDLRAAGLPPGGIIINRVQPDLLPEDAVSPARHGQLDLDHLARGLSAVGIEPEAGLVKVLADEASEHATRVMLQEAERGDLHALALPQYEIPLVPDGVDRGNLHDIGLRLVDS